MVEFKLSHEVTTLSFTGKILCIDFDTGWCHSCRRSPPTWSYITAQEVKYTGTGKVNTNIVLITWFHFSAVDKYSVDLLRTSPTHRWPGGVSFDETFWSWSVFELNWISFDTICFGWKSLVNRHIHGWKTVDRITSTAPLQKKASLLVG